MMTLASLILAASLTGQATATDGPARTWVSGIVDGKPVDLWGWHDANGWVRFHKHENHHLWPEYKPATLPKPLPVQPRPIVPNTGIVLESNGTLNSGLNLSGTRPTGMLETNDPDLARKLDREGPCPNPNPDPYQPDPFAPVDPLSKYRDYFLPAALLVAAGFIALAVRNKK